MDGKKGHPVRTTLSEMGPLLLGNMLELNDTQTGVLYAGFDLADDQGLLLDKIEQVVRLIRSKGVGVYFVTQNPMDLPDNVLGSWDLRFSMP